MPLVYNLSPESFTSLINIRNINIVVLFYQDWKKESQEVSELWTEIGMKYKYKIDIIISRLDTTKYSTIKIKYNIDNTPSIYVFNYFLELL